MSRGREATRPEVVPVLDLRHGAVVRARAGERHAYGPDRRERGAVGGGAVHDRVEVGDVEPARRQGGEQPDTGGVA
jgi:hypothetical protein